MISLADKLIACGASWKGLSGKIASIAAPSTRNNQVSSGVFESSGACVFHGFVSGPSEYYVAKITSGMSLAWARSVTMTTFSGIADVAVDASGNVAVLSAGRASGSYNYLVVLYFNSSGTLQWQRKMTITGATAHINAGRVAFDASGNVIVSCTYTIAASTAHVAKYNSSGTLQWQRQLSYGSNDLTNAVCSVDSSGNVFVGCFSTAPATDESFVVKYNSSGSLQWQKKYISNSQNTRIASLAVSDEICFTDSAFSRLVKLDTSGAVSWCKSISTGATSALSYPNIDASGNVYAAVYEAAEPLLGYTIKLGSGSGDIQWQRSIDGYASTTSRIDFSRQLDNSVFFAGADYSSATKKNAIVGQIPESGGTGTYGYLTVAESTCTMGSNLSVSVTTSTLTDSAGSLVDAAGDATDADYSSTLTVTTYTKS